MKELTRYQIDPSVGHGVVEHLQITDEFSMSHVQATYHKDQVYHASGAGVTRFHFRTSGSASMEFDGVKKIEESGPVCQVLHHPRGMGDVECIKAGIPVSWVTLGLGEDFIESQLGSDFKQLPELLRSVQKNTDQFMIRDMPLQPEMRRHLIDIENLQHEGGLRSLYLEAKALQLVCDMVGFLGTDDHSHLPVRLRERDQDAVEEARRILEAEFISPPTIEQLAIRVGLNRNKLMYGFRHLVGETIADYCQHIRLTLATQYLRDTHKLVANIAEDVGYSTAAGFSTAFKRKYNVTPRQVRQGVVLQTDLQQFIT